MTQHCESPAVRTLHLPRHHCACCNHYCPTSLLAPLLACHCIPTTSSPICPHSVLTATHRLTIPPLHNLVTDTNLCITDVQMLLRVTLLHSPSCHGHSLASGPFAILWWPLVITSSFLLLICALFHAVQRYMSVCQTQPAANPGGPRGGAQVGRSLGGKGLE